MFTRTQEIPHALMMKDETILQLLLIILQTPMLSKAYPYAQMPYT